MGFKVKLDFEFRIWDQKMSQNFQLNLEDEI